MNWTELQETLRQSIRERRGVQTEIARKLNISQPSVAQYVSGNKNIPPEHLDTILEVIGKTLILTDKP